MINQYYGQNPMYNQSQYNATNAAYNGLYSQGQQLVRVNGINGAKAYNMAANSTVALFDSNEDLMYIKQTDGAGFPSIRTFEFKEVTGGTPAPLENDFVTRKELEDYVKQFIRDTEQPNKPSAGAKKGKSAGDVSTNDAD